VQRSLPGAAALGACCEVRSRCLGTVGVPWRAHAGRGRAERQRKGEGVRAFSSLSPRSHGQGPGRGVVESTERWSTATSGTPTSTNTYGGGVINSRVDFLKSGSQVFDEMPEPTQNSNF
jgi:hypothetical protein